MKTTDINKLVLEEHKSKGSVLLESVCHNLTKEQRRVVEGIYKTFEPLMEAALNPAQIQQIFQQVEQGATAAGGNRTLAGKGVDTAKQVNDTINKVGTWLQNTTPVQGFDAKFEQLKQSVRSKMGEDSKIIQGIDKLGQLAKDNPGKTAAIIGILTTIASFAGTPAAGAVVGGILRGTTELLKGEKLSTTIGKGLKGAAYGWMIGKSLQEIGGLLRDGISFVADKLYPGVTHVTQIVNNRLLWDVALKDSDVKTLSGLQQAASKAMFANDPNYTALYNKAADFVTKTVNQPGYYDEIVKNAASADKFYSAANAAAQTMKGIGAGAQGAVTATAGSKQQAESRTYTPEQVTALFEHIVIAQKLSTQLQEGIWDDIKSGTGKTLGQVAGVAGKAARATTQQVGQGIKTGAAKAVGAVANKLQQVGHNIATKTTADKLQSAWKAAGSPTDSEAIIDLLTAQGIDKSVITGAMKAVAPFASVDRSRLPDVSKLNLQQKQQLLKQLDAVEQGQQPTSAPALTVPGTSAKSAPGAPVTQPTSAPKVVGVPTDASPIAVPGGGATGLTVPGVSNTTATPAAPTTTGGGSPAKIPKPKVPYSAIQPKVTGTSAPAVVKVSPARNPGAPTADEYDKFQQKVQAAMKKQA